MAYPSPSIYYYRVRGFKLPTQPLEIGYFLPEYSSDGGVTYHPFTVLPFDSLQEAKQHIQTIVQNEAQFQAQVNAGTIVAGTTYAYP